MFRRWRWLLASVAAIGVLACSTPTPAASFGGGYRAGSVGGYHGSTIGGTLGGSHLGSSVGSTRTGRFGGGYRATTPTQPRATQPGTPPTVVVVHHYPYAYGWTWGIPPGYGGFWSGLFLGSLLHPFGGGWWYGGHWITGGPSVVGIVGDVVLLALILGVIKWMAGRWS